MLKAQHKNWAQKPFFWFLKWLIYRKFAKVYVEELPQIPDNKAVLLLANHWGWWDGFTHFYINFKIFKRRFYLLMLEEELQKRPLFKLWGAFSIKKNHRSSIKTIRYVQQLLTEKNNLVVIFPQGRIESMHKNQIHFEPGIWKMAEGTKTAFTYLFSVVLTDYFSQPKPAIYFYFKAISSEEIISAEVLELSYNNFYNSCKTQQIQKYS